MEGQLPVRHHVLTAAVSGRLRGAACLLAGAAVSLSACATASAPASSPLAAITIADITVALDETRSGSTLLNATTIDDPHLAADLLVSEIERVVGHRTGLLVDARDTRFLAAVHSLRRMPRSLRSSPTATLMALIDEWSALLYYDAPMRPRSERFLDRARGARGPSTLEELFPLLYRDASSVAAQAGLTDVGTERPPPRSAVRTSASTLLPARRP